MTSDIVEGTAVGAVDHSSSSDSARTVGRFAYSLFGLVLLIILVISGVAYQSQQKATDAAMWVEHTLTARNIAAEVLVLLVDAETGQRGYVLTGEEQYLEPYNAAIAALAESLDRLAGTISDNAVQVSHTAELRSLATKKLEELAETIELRKNSGSEAALEIVSSGIGKKYMDDARAVVTLIQAEEDRLLKERREARQANQDAAEAAILLGTILIAVIGVIGIIHLNRNIRQRLDVRDTLKRSNDALERSNQKLTEAEARAGAILEMAADGIITIDKRGIVLSFNAAAEQIFGYTAAEVVGGNVSLLMPSPSRAEHDGYLRRALNESTHRVIGVHREVVARRKDGSCFPISPA